MVGPYCVASSGHLQFCLLQRGDPIFLRWGALGAAIQNAQEGSRRRLVLAMVPSLLAWPALMMNTVSGLWILLAGFILIGGYDMSREGRVGFPRWYLMLRAVLTLVVAIFHGFLLLRLRG